MMNVIEAVKFTVDALSPVKDSVCIDTGVSVEIYTNMQDDGVYDDKIVFKWEMLYGILHLMAGVEDVGYVEIIDMSGYRTVDLRQEIACFVMDYFVECDMLRIAETYCAKEV